MIPVSQTRSRTPVIWMLALGLTALLWAHWTGFVSMSEYWSSNPEYSHGYLVPLIAIVLLWCRFERLEMGRPSSARIGLLLIAAGVVPFFFLPATAVREWGLPFAILALVGAGWLLRPDAFDGEKFRPSWWGLPLLVAGISFRLVSGYYYIEWFDGLSLIPCLAGIVLLTVGWHAIRWSWPAILFLVFMVPLPFTLEGMMRGPLRRVGTLASTFLMQTMGLSAFADGNRHEIIVGGMTHRIGVSEACSGLSMLMIFFALSASVAILMKRPKWEKMTVLFSAVPIALVANVARITVTGIMLYTLQDEQITLGLGSISLIDMDGTEFAQTFFHDWAGWLMMPLALGLLWLEMAILKRLVVVEEEVPLAMESSPPADTDTGSRRNDGPDVNSDSKADSTKKSEKEVPAPAAVGK